MKYTRLQTLLIAAIVSLLLCFGSLGCFVTAYDLDIGRLYHLLPVLAGFSLLFPTLYLWKPGRVILLCLMGLFTGFFWRMPLPRQQLLSLAADIYGRYASAYSLPIPELFLGALPGDVSLPIFYWGLILLLVCTRAVCGRRGSQLAVLLGGLPLVFCLVVTDAVPAPLSLTALLFAAGLLSITAAVRRESAAQANRLILPAALYLGLTLGGLLLLLPREGYINRAQDTRDWLIARLRPLSASMGEQLNDYVSDHASGLQRVNGPVSSVNLAILNGQPKTGRLAMYVTSTRSQPIYLRFQDYDQYTGVGWYANRNREESFSGSGTQDDFLTVETVLSQGNRYLPYYPALPAALSGGAAANLERNRTYSLVLSDDPAETPLGAQDRLSYLALPKVTADGAAALLETILPEGLDSASAAQIIADYVSASAQYDRKTGAMPSDAADFALWFLEDSDTGYCVHFATAAVVMLRGYGIPARYVTGYLAYGNAGQAVPVTEDQAHAWAEYYDDQRGAWMVLEATPADGLAAPADTLPQDSTTPSTQPPTENTPEELPTYAPATIPVPTPEETPAQSPNFTLPLAIWGGMAVLVLAVWLQWRIRIDLRRRHQRAADNNTQALLLWQEVQLLARRAGITPPEELAALAEKAAYSPHTLSSRELSAMKSFQSRCIRQLRAAPIYRRVIYRYIYALY